MLRWLATAALACAALLPSATAAGAATPTLRAGAGQTDITPPKTGYFLGGWTRADRLAEGQSTRLFANTLVLQRGDRKVALVAAELFAVPAGLQEDVAKAVADLGLDRSSILLSASHTHSGPGGYANNPTYNTAAPSLETATDPLSFARFFSPAPADPQLYAFLVKQLATSIRRADADLAPAAAGWAEGRLAGLTQNRSIEAHLRDHGVVEETGKGSPQQDPDGAEHTIDPSVDVLRVDKLVRVGKGRKRRTVRRPIGAWTNFANHGTVVHAETRAYSGDHHAAAWRGFSSRVRKAGKVPRKQVVVGVYPNSAEGDQTAGIANVGPAGATYVGDREARAMFATWKRAKLSRRPVIDLRFTRACFCGRDTSTGKVAAAGKEGVPFLTGSEEGRGPLFDLTGQSFEGRTNPVPDPEQGNKLVVPVGDPPDGVPLTVLRVGDRAFASVPGEATKEVGVRIRAGVLQALAPAGVKRVVIAGLTNEFVQYITTPEEYGAQSYEGASSLYGPNEGTFMVDQLSVLARALASGEPGPEPAAEDVSYGVTPNGPAYPEGAASGAITQQPAASVVRLDRATLTWTGGAEGADRPVGSAFITAQRKVKGRWRAYASDLGLQFLWRVAGDAYSAQWEVPRSAPAGEYRFVVTATRFRLQSSSFTVAPTTALHVEANDGTVGLHYPDAVVDVDLTTRPERATGGRITLVGADGKRRVVRITGDGNVRVPSGLATPVSVPAGGARDRYGNTTGEAFTLG